MDVDGELYGGLVPNQPGGRRLRGQQPSMRHCGARQCPMRRNEQCRLARSQRGGRRNRRADHDVHLLLGWLSQGQCRRLHHRRHVRGGGGRPVRLPDADPVAHLWELIDARGDGDQPGDEHCHRPIGNTVSMAHPGASAMHRARQRGGSTQGRGRRSDLTQRRLDDSSTDDSWRPTSIRTSNRLFRFGHGDRSMQPPGAVTLYIPSDQELDGESPAPKSCA